MSLNHTSLGRQFEPLALDALHHRPRPELAARGLAPDVAQELQALGRLVERVGGNLDAECVGMTATMAIADLGLRPRISVCAR